LRGRGFNQREGFREDDGGVQAVKGRFSNLLLGVSVAVSCVACNRVSWQVSRELCGQIRIVDKQKSTVLKDTDLMLYRSKSTHFACCSDAEVIADLRTDAAGMFNSGKLAAGRYFVVVKNSPQISFPIFLEKDYDGGKCSVSRVLSFDRNTGKTEQTVTILLRPSK
jgi:hypothetical protein